MFRTLAVAATAVLMTASAASALPCWDGVKDTCTPRPEPPPWCVKGPNGDVGCPNGVIISIQSNASETANTDLIARDWDSVLVDADALPPIFEREDAPFTGGSHVGVPYFGSQAPMGDVTNLWMDY